MGQNDALRRLATAGGVEWQDSLIVLLVRFKRSDGLATLQRNLTERSSDDRWFDVTSRILLLFQNVDWRFVAQIHKTTCFEDWIQQTDGCYG